MSRALLIRCALAAALLTVRISSAVQASPPTARFAVRAADPTEAPSWKGAGISGVWMGIVSVFGTWEPQPRWRTFFDDGVMFADLPDEGLAGFDRAAYRASHQGRASFWQTYAFSGSSGQSRRDGTTATWSLRLEKPGLLRIDGQAYHRCFSVDGLRLDGSWTSYAKPEDPLLDTLPIGQRPVIHFTRDGRFTDDGLFAMFIKSSGDDRPGTGRYELRDFTVILRYDDGRVRQEGLTGLLGADPSRLNDAIYLRRCLLNRRSKR